MNFVFLEDMNNAFKISSVVEYNRHDEEDYNHYMQYFYYVGFLLSFRGK